MKDTRQERIQKKLAKQLKKLREAKKFTRKDFSEAIGVNYNYYLMVERGERKLGMNTLIKASKILEVDVKDLIPF